MSEFIERAYRSSSSLRKRIYDAINETPQHATLFEDMSKYLMIEYQMEFADDDIRQEEGLPPKKRKLGNGTAAPVNNAQKDQPQTVLVEAKDISFSIPQRKKLHLSIVQYGSDENSSTTSYTLCARNPASGQVEFEYPTAAFAYAVRVPVPEKAQKQFNYCLIPKIQPATVAEALMWTVNVVTPKPNQQAPETPSMAPGIVLGTRLDDVLQRSGAKLRIPDGNEFFSQLVESHRKNETAYHVKAFRGNKDGYLFFLANGIFFGFKKPLAFFPFEEIDSISYTAVLQRTFNLVIVTRGANDTESQELEFSMLDQADFAGIDAYVRTHQLQDSSMAETRRAKKFNVNGIKSEDVEGQETDGQTELQKAEQELDDEEDELEEDYDPGSDGESEGSGSSDDEDYEYEQRVKSKDLVKDELGSEAEDVEVTEDEEEDEEDGDEGEDEDEEPAPQKHEKDKKPSRSLTHQATVKQTAPTVIVHSRNEPDFDDEDQL